MLYGDSPRRQRPAASAVARNYVRLLRLAHSHWGGRHNLRTSCAHSLTLWFAPSLVCCVAPTHTGPGYSWRAILACYSPGFTGSYND